ncbi:MAG: o-succinylbenzoate synthase [Flavobacteriales bacterium]|nr:o-succinylbenzoate synthase [Flavobacteriales bacterium]
MNVNGPYQLISVYRQLAFKVPARTSRDTLNYRDCWYIIIKDNSGNTGLGECAPIYGLSLESREQVVEGISRLPREFNSTEEVLLASAPVASLHFAVESAVRDLLSGGKRQYAGQSPLLSGKAIPINGLVWMNDCDAMVNEAAKKLEDGYRCIKIKIGALPFEDECEVLHKVREKAPSGVELRVDANGAWDNLPVDEIMRRLELLSRYRLHSIEQPVFDTDVLGDLCRRSPVPIALDESLIRCTSRALRIVLLDQTKPAYLVLKPGLLGGIKASEEWISLAEERNIGWWVTSALESSCGLYIIAQWVASLNYQGYQGLGTGALFSNNLPTTLSVSNGQLICNRPITDEWDFIFRA